VLASHVNESEVATGAVLVVVKTNPEIGHKGAATPSFNLTHLHPH